MAKFDQKLGSGEAIPQIVMNAVPDMNRVQPSDWSVLAMVDGHRSVHAICQMATMADDDARSALARLLEFGMITMPDSSTSKSSSVAKSSPIAKSNPITKSSSSAHAIVEPLTSSISISSNKISTKVSTSRSDTVKVNPFKEKKPPKRRGKDRVRVSFPEHWPVSVEQFMFDPMELDVDVEMSMEKRKQVVYYHYHLRRVTYYDLFQVPRDADQRAVRRAYFTLSKEFHPDLFFRKDLGRFQRPLEDVFKWLTEAYATLSNEKKRKTYDNLVDRGLLGDWQTDGISARTNPAVSSSRARAVAQKQQKAQKQKPPASPRSRSSIGGPRSRSAGPRSRSTGPISRAGRVAVDSAPTAETWIQRGEKVEVQGDWARAAEYYNNALEDQFVAEAALGAARCFIKLDQQMEQAESLCRRVLGLELSNKGRVDALIVLARVLEQQERLDEAHEVYAEAHQIDPSNPVVRIDMERVESQTS